MKTPQPGQPVRGSTTGRPIMALLDLLGRRWVLRILWELRDVPVGFRALQARCDGMSSSVLMRRLQEMQTAGIIAQEPDGGYALSPEGHDLLEALQGLHTWAERWAERTQLSEG